MDKSKITKKDYKMFCMIIKEFWFKKKIQQLQDLLYIMAHFFSKKEDCWTLFGVNGVTKEMERNQFSILNRIVETFDISEIKKELHIIANRYKKSNQNKKSIYKDEI